MMRILVTVTAGLIVAAAPLAAQEVPENQAASPVQVPAQNEVAPVTTTAGSNGVGEVGQRQTRSDAAPNIEPLGRIENRIENRVENRLRNRIDRNYSPVANAAEPFARAIDQAQDAAKVRPRR